jgi:hypothetical protein
MSTVRFRHSAAALLLVTVYATCATWAAHRRPAVAADPLVPALRIVDQIGGEMAAAVASGERLYVGVGPRVQIVDVSRPGAARVLGRTAVLTGTVRDLVLHGDQLVVAADTGLHVLDASDPGPPRSLGWLALASGASKLAIEGDLVFVIGQGAGFRTQGGMAVVDIASPRRPQRLAFLPLDDATAVAVAGDARHVYVAADAPDSGVAGTPWVIDVADPAAPMNVGVVSTVRGVAGFARAGDLLWATTDRDPARLRALSLSDPAEPRPLGALELAAHPGGVAVSGDRVFAVSQSEHSPIRRVLFVVDGADPSAPVEIGRYEETAHLYDPAPIDDASKGTAPRLALPHDKGLTLLDLQVAAEPRVDATLGGAGWWKNVAVDGRRVYVANDYALQVYGPSEGGLELRGRSPTFGQSVNLGNGPGTGLEADGGFAVVANQLETRLQVIDCRDPSAPRLAGEYRGFGLSSPNRVAVRDRFAFVAPGGDPLLVLDLAVPEIPAFAALVAGDDEWMVTGWNMDLAPDLGRVYVMGMVHRDGEMIERVGAIDVTRPAEPVKLGVIDAFVPAGQILDLAAAGDYLLALVSDVARSTTVLRVADFRDPAAPRWLPASGAVEGLRYLRARPPLAYGLSWEHGLVALDITYPADIREIARLPELAGAAGVALDEDGRAHVVAFERGLYVVELAGWSGGGPTSGDEDWRVFLPRAVLGGR